MKARAFAPLAAVILTTLLSSCGESDGNEPRDPETADTPMLFRDVSKAMGIDFVHRHGGTGRKYLPETMGSGACALDYDGDGWMDLYLVQSGRLPGADSASPLIGNRLYRNDGGRRFVDVTEQTGTGDTGYGMGAVAGDIDNDGDVDIYVVNFGPNVLYRNNGDGTFEDDTLRAGLGDDSWGSSAALLDADGDGDLDIYLVNYLEFSVATHVDCGQPDQGKPAYCHPDVYPMAADVFYRNDGDGTFTDATAEAGLTDTTGKGLGVVVADLDGDDRPDIYVANDSTPNFLYRNLGEGKFEETGLLDGVSHNDDGKTEAGMGVDIGDVNGDGHPDVFVTNLTQETNSLYLGSKDGFTYATREAGLYTPSFRFLGFGTDLADLDNDGDLDISVANGHVIDNVELFNDGFTWKEPGQVFLNDGAGRFTELPPADCGDFAVPRVGRGLVSVDFDNDGGLDLLVTHNDHPAVLYRNMLPERGRWIGFHLVGTNGSSDAVGARVTVEHAGGHHTEEKKLGGSYQTSHDPRLHFGLGDSTGSVRVTIRWPGGTESRHDDLEAGRYHRIVEPERERRNR